MMTTDKKTIDPAGAGHRVSKVLIVDDDPIVLKALTMGLGNRGYQVLAAADGSEAIAIVRDHHPDLILLDIFFPPDMTQGGMGWDGFRIIEWLRYIGVAGNVPMIIMSSAAASEYKGRSLAAGAAAFFSKPINIPELVDAIEKISERTAQTALNFDV